MRELLTLNELLVMHLIDDQPKSILNDLVVKEWEAQYNEKPFEVIQALKDRQIVSEQNGRYIIASQYHRQLDDTAFIYEITQERPKLLDEHKAYLVYRNNRNVPEEELLIRMYDDLLAYSKNPEKHQQAHARLSTLFLEIDEDNHSEHHMHCAQMLDTLLQMEALTVNVKMKTNLEDIRARFPIPNEFLDRYIDIIEIDKRRPSMLRDDILTAARQLRWNRSHLEAAANYIVLRAQGDRNAEKYLLAYLFKSAKIYNFGTVKYMRKHRLDDNDGRFQVMSTEQRRVQLRRPIEQPVTRYEVKDVSGRAVTAIDEAAEKFDPPKKSNNFLIIFFLIVFFPVGLILMWLSHWKRWLKIVISAIYVMAVFSVTDDDESLEEMAEEQPPINEEAAEFD